MPYAAWIEIARILRDRIESGQLPPGSVFPTNSQLVAEFGANLTTIDRAVRQLQVEGLIISFGSGKRQRMVRPERERSVRTGGFLTEYGPRATIRVKALETIRDPADLPPEVAERLHTHMTRPVAVRLVTVQLRDGVPVALSNAYVPTRPFRKRIETLLRQLADTSRDVYDTMEHLGATPTLCRERLMADLATGSEAIDLGGTASVPLLVVRIQREVTDHSGDLLEYCYLTDRADVYWFEYQFRLRPDAVSQVHPAARQSAAETRNEYGAGDSGTPPRAKK